MSLPSYVPRRLSASCAYGCPVALVLCSVPTCPYSLGHLSDGQNGTEDSMHTSSVMLER